MKYVRDTQKGLSQRPHFLPGELDAECEQIVTDFMRESNGSVSWPVTTDTLTKLIERDTSDVDLYADLSGDGADVEGVTDMLVGEKPRVRISNHLWEKRFENRLRTTLTHEYGHVRFHAPLYALDSGKGLISAQQQPQKCKRENILGAPEYDWMEWQAGYVCGAMLMPISEMRKLTTEFCIAENLDTPIQIVSIKAQVLIKAVTAKFAVSEEAARVRLIKLAFLTAKKLPPSLF